jgi:HEAT repeat protein
MDDALLTNPITLSYLAVQTPPDLIAQLSSDDPDIVRFAVETLSSLRALAAVAPLLALLNHPVDREPTVRAAAAEAIGNLGVADVVELLERPMQSDADADVRCASARALGKVGTPEAVDVLVAALVNSDELLLACISEVLEGLGYRF